MHADMYENVEIENVWLSVLSNFWSFIGLVTCTTVLYNIEPSSRNTLYFVNDASS